MGSRLLQGKLQFNEVSLTMVPTICATSNCADLVSDLRQEALCVTKENFLQDIFIEIQSSPVPDEAFICQQRIVSAKHHPVA